MNILLLGSFGFIGTNIIKYIDRNIEDTSVIAFDRFSTHSDKITFESISKVYAGDFSDEYLLDRVFTENKIDIVIHSLSASVPSSSIDNEFDLKFNVIPTIKLLNVMVKHHVKNIVFLSSGGAIYGDHYVDESGHVEEEVLFPKSAYGVSKLVIEKYLYLYSIQYGVNSLVLRLSNPYGPYHYSQKQGIINIAIEKALNNETFEIWGDGKGKKDYIYIEDFCKILFEILKRWDRKYTVLNIGSGMQFSVNEIVHAIKENVNDDFMFSHLDAKSLDVQGFILNVDKMKTIIGNYDYTDLRQGILKTKSWYDSRSKKKRGAATIKDI